MKRVKMSALIILFFVVVLIVICVGIWVASWKDWHMDGFGNEGGDEMSENYVVRVIDGDTFDLASGERLRLICVDTPERGSEGYDSAREFLSERILGKEVRMESDRDERDSYGRLLRYVYVSEGDREVFVNREIVSRGYGVVFRYGNDTSKCDEIGS